MRVQLRGAQRKSQQALNKAERVALRSTEVG
jgi:hypothetical protein